MNFKELATARFSVRKFTDEAVSQADLDAIMTCVQLAPSACNRQPWKFLLLASDTANAWVRPDDGKSHGDIDLRIAVEHLALAVADRGLGTCWVCNYDVEAVKRLFPVEGFEAVAIIPLGHIAEDCPNPGKKRKGLDEIWEKL